ncbi:unnamed protein product [Microthlaspi erraticum]|uniref:Uncharacterized protein n=1 Tax=Microthlaspi erraticum TaxID=1685480 RepID=A0A6D2HPP2_9BRAS|nr:unnamed protein product [Microthlaspi erraticum]
MSAFNLNGNVKNADSSSTLDDIDDSEFSKLQEKPRPLNTERLRSLDESSLTELSASPQLRNVDSASASASRLHDHADNVSVDFNLNSSAAKAVADSTLLAQGSPCSERLDIIDGDIVRNKETGVQGVILEEDGRQKVLTLSHPAKIPLGKEDVLWVRLFKEGDKVVTIEYPEAMGVSEVVHVERTVSLTADDVEIKEVDVNGLEPFRISFTDQVSFEGCVGRVRSVKLRVTFSMEGASRNEKFTVDDPSVDLYQPFYQSSVEKAMENLYHLGQRVWVVPSQGWARVTEHSVDKTGVNWFYRDSADKTPPDMLYGTPNQIVMDNPCQRGNWCIGQRCIYEEKEYLISQCNQSLVTVKTEGTKEDVVMESTELMLYEVEEELSSFTLADCFRLADCYGIQIWTSYGR